MVLRWISVVPYPIENPRTSRAIRLQRKFFRKSVGPVQLHSLVSHAARHLVDEHLGDRSVDCRCLAGFAAASRPIEQGPSSLEIDRHVREAPLHALLLSQSFAELDPLLAVLDRCFKGCLSDAEADRRIGGDAVGVENRQQFSELTRW